MHHNSDRTGVRLIGPKPEWARKDGGEAGLHPSNIHDNAYAVGSMDFTGDMPVILGPDGPSLGGFVCPAVIAAAEIWKIGQLRPGDAVRFRAVSLEQARKLDEELDAAIETLSGDWPKLPEDAHREEPVLRSARGVLCRADGDRYLLLEYGPNVLDLSLRFRVHALETQLRSLALAGIIDITPGVRSLQIHYNTRRLSRAALLDALDALREPHSADSKTFPRHRVSVHLPLSWDDPATQLAIRKYMQSVRPDAPWCPEQYRIHPAHQRARFHRRGAAHRVRRELSGAGIGRRLPGRAGGDAARSAASAGHHEVQSGAHLDAGKRRRHRRRVSVRVRHGRARADTSSSAARCRCGTPGAPRANSSLARPGCCASSIKSGSTRCQRRGIARNSRSVSAWRVSADIEPGEFRLEGLSRVSRFDRSRSGGIQAKAAGCVRRGARALGRRRSGSRRSSCPTSPRRGGGRRVPEGCMPVLVAHDGERLEYCG